MRADKDPFDLDALPRPPRDRGEGAMARLTRTFLFALVCLGVVWGFWKNNERIVKDLNAKSAVQDQTGTLSEEDRTFLLTFADSLRTRHGLKFRLIVAPGPVPLLEPDPHLLFVGLSTGSGKAQVLFPPLLARALAPGLAADLSGRLTLALQHGDWPQELKESLILVWEGLSDTQNPSTPNQTSPKP